MRPDDRADRIKTLRDLWSEMMQNHTDIQRLWKNVGKRGFVLSTGIEAAPPISPFIESSSSSSSSGSVGCGSCSLDLTSVTLTIWISVAEWDGTFTLTWDGTKFVYCKNTPLETFGQKSIEYSVRCDGSNYGPWLIGFSEAGCTGDQITIASAASWDELSLDCDPFYWSGDGLGGTAVITE